MELTEEQIESIADELDSGLKVFVNIETLEIKTIIDFDSFYDADPEPWEKDIEEIEENYDKYFMFEKMDARESIWVMEEFTETVGDEKLRDRLELCLQLSKPFRNFKDVINCAGDYRKQWFKFKKENYIDFVKEQLLRYNNRSDFDE